MTPMLDVLNNYYHKQGIHPMYFRCCSREVCAYDVPVFTEAKSTFVGTRYEDGSGGCRLLFLGLDAGEGKEWPCREQRTPEAIRGKIESDPPGENPHWWGTLRFALRILSRFDRGLGELWNELDLSHGDCRKWGTTLLRQKKTAFLKLVTPSFAHVNAARCSVNAEGNKQAKEVLYLNCHRYLCGEIQALAPDVIVTQGDRAKDGLLCCVQGIENGSKCQDECNQPPCKPCNKVCKVVRLGNRKVLWISTYHPAQQAGLFKKEGGPSWNCYAAAAVEFIKRGCSESL